MKSLCPKCAKYFITCQSTGRVPIGTIGFGTGRGLAHPEAQASAEQYDLHQRAPQSSSPPTLGRTRVTDEVRSL